MMSYSGNFTEIADGLDCGSTKRGEMEAEDKYPSQTAARQSVVESKMLTPTFHHSPFLARSRVCKLHDENVV